LGLGGLDVQRQQARTGQYGAETERMLGGQQNLTTQRGQNIERELGMAGIGQQRYATDIGATTQRRQQDIERQLGLRTADTNQYSAETARTNVTGQLELGQGQLGFQNRELDVTDAFRREQLGTQSQLERERLAADTLSNRYQVFGRAQAPNTRMAQGFRS
jgi:hypothetical protein